MRYLTLPLTMSTSPDKERLLGKRFKQKLRSVFSSKSRNLDMPDARPTSANVPSSATLTPLSVSSTHSDTSRVHLVQETDIVNPHSTVQGSMSIGALISYLSCFDQALDLPPRSWIRCGRSCAYKLFASQRDPRKSCVENINGRRYVLDPCISCKP